jgi:ABC-type multidrug transport system ATPase subunit
MHQPRSSIVELFDDITLLSEGLVMYSGRMKDMSRYFATLVSLV